MKKQAWIVVHTPTEAVEKLARERGWNGDYDSVLDYVDYCDVQREIEKPTFHKARLTALRLRKKDFWSYPQVKLMERTDDPNDPQSPVTWETLQTWEWNAKGVCETWTENE